MVTLLIQHDAKLKVGDFQAKNYPLHYACEAGNIELVQLLLRQYIHLVTITLTS
jgi:ankyrin repeat protein